MRASYNMHQSVHIGCARGPAMTAPLLRGHTLGTAEGHHCDRHVVGEGREPYRYGRPLVTIRLCKLIFLYRSYGVGEPRGALPSCYTSILCSPAALLVRSAAIIRM